MKTVGSGGSAVTTVFVYDAMGKLFAEYRSDSAQPPNGGGTSYLTTDHLGSTRVVTKQEKSVQARYDYLPFGEELGVGIGSRSSAMKYSGLDATRQKFTSKERDSESGLDYFLARYYSSGHGRFTSPDEFRGGPTDLFDPSESPSPAPMLYANPADPQSLNKYQYCYNNPLAAIDPDGHQPRLQGNPTGVIPTKNGRDILTGVAKGLANIVIGFHNYCVANGGPGTHVDEYKSDGDVQAVTMVVVRDVSIFGAFLSGKGGGLAADAEETAAVTSAISNAGEAASTVAESVNATKDSLVRLGKGPETAEQLAADAARAEANGFPHGVSTKRVNRVSGTDRANRS